MRNLQKAMMTMLVAMGVIAIVNRIPQLRHLIKGETLFVNGKRVQDPQREYMGQ